MRRWLNVFAMVWLIAQSVSTSSLAEDQKIPAGSVILIPGALGRIESYGPMGYWRLCSPQSIGLTEWRAGYLQHLLKPTSSQMDSLGRLQVASAAAKDAIASSCTKETVATGPAHFAEMEKRLTGLLSAIKVLRQPYEAFYAALNDRQKAVLDGLGPSRRGWRW
jgi:LTXXQ motif family protein